MLRTENDILRMIADGKPLTEIAHHVCVRMEKVLPGVVSSILHVDRAGLLHPLGAPSLPDYYLAAIEGMMIGPEAGSCGTAAYFRKPVFVQDITTDPRFAQYARLVATLGLRTCWSLPVLDALGNPVAVLAIYFAESRRPKEAEREFVKVCVELCAMALRRHEHTLDHERRATIDALTGLPNRTAFDVAMRQIPCNEPGSWALFMIDLDNLKIVNDTFGHLAGDALIRAAGDRISRVMAPDVTFRLGGDEFAVIIQEAGALAQLDETASNIINALESTADCEGHAQVPRGTIGGAVLSLSEHSAAEVNEAADFALYRAKETGRGGFVRYWPGIGTRMTHRRAAIRDVSDALAEDRIEAHYQAIVDIGTGEIIGLEALCRMRTNDGVVVPAAAFQDAMSDARIASELTERMMTIIARDIQGRRAAQLPDVEVGLNVSTADFYTGSLVAKLRGIFDQAGVPLKGLVLEVSENVYLGQRDRVVAREIEKLREAGVRVALDDFGTGYGSLTHLLSVPVDIIKIDPMFIARLWPDDPSMIIVQGLIDIARGLGIDVVAEGIETEVQASQLWAMGCSLGQGFAFARPVDCDAVFALLRRHGRGVSGATRLYPSDDRNGAAGGVAFRQSEHDEDFATLPPMSVAQRGGRRAR